MRADDLDRQRVLAVVEAIPRGSVATYGQVASEAGLPGRARLVGRLLGALPAGAPLPWHRVVNASGRISLPPGGGRREQARRLRREGIPVDADGRLSLKEHRWVPDW